MDGAGIEGKSVIHSLRRRWRRPLGPQDLLEAQVLQSLLKLERKVPGFEHTNFDHWKLYAALQEYLGMEVPIEPIRDNHYPLVARYIRRSPIEAELVYLEGDDRVSIQIPATTPPEEWRDILYHELWHLIGAHPLPFGEALAGGNQWGFWQPPKVICHRRPPFNLDTCAADSLLLEELIQWCEDDADHAVEHLRTISALGKRTYTSEELLLGI